MNTLSQLWAAGRFPIRDGLYLADGRAWSASIDSNVPGGALALREPINLDVLLAADPDGLTSFVVSKRVRLADGGGFLFCGEGSWGSEGLFGRLDADGQPVWVVYLGVANPFTEIEADGEKGVLRFRSTSGVVVTFPMFAPAVAPPAGG